MDIAAKVNAKFRSELVVKFKPGAEGSSAKMTVPKTKILLENNTTTSMIGTTYNGGTKTIYPGATWDGTSEDYWDDTPAEVSSLSVSISNGNAQAVGIYAGDKLTANVKGAGREHCTFQWYRQGEAIPDAKSESYTVAEQDEGLELSVKAIVKVDDTEWTGKASAGYVAIGAGTEFRAVKVKLEYVSDFSTYFLTISNGPRSGGGIKYEYCMTGSEVKPAADAAPVCAADESGAASFGTSGLDSWDYYSVYLWARKVITQSNKASDWFYIQPVGLG